MSDIFYLEKRNKIIKQKRGLSDYKLDFNLSDNVLQEIVNYSSSYFVGSGGTVEEEPTVQTVQHWGAIATLAESPQTFTYSALGLPTTITNVNPPAVIFWNDRVVLLDSYDSNSVTLHASTPGVKDLPVMAGLEFTGYAPPLPSTIYNPRVIGFTLLEDCSVYISALTSTSVTLDRIRFYVKDLPFDVGVHLAGSETEDGEESTWYAQVNMTTAPQTFNFEDMNFVETNEKSYGVMVTLNSDSDSFSYYSLGLPTTITGARIAGVSPKHERNGYITAVSNTSFTLHAFATRVKDFPCRYNIEIRGGA